MSDTKCSCIGGIVDPTCVEHGEQTVPETKVHAQVEVEAIYPGMVILLVTTSSGVEQRFTCAEREGFAIEEHTLPKLGGD
jgi:hypothetical protein